jgi:hypothetical protein
MSEKLIILALAGVALACSGLLIFSAIKVAFLAAEMIRHALS